MTSALRSLRPCLAATLSALLATGWPGPNAPAATRLAQAAPVGAQGAPAGNQGAAGANELVSARVCIGCHSPVDGPPLSGRLTGRWLAPNITPDPVSGIGSWPRDALFRYLRLGSAPGRAQAGGPMTPVVEAMQSMSDSDVYALADWLAHQPAHRDPADMASASERGKRLETDPALLRGASLPAEDRARSGAALYQNSCATCHGADGAGSGDGHFPSMFHNSAVGRRTPFNLVAALLTGVERQVGSHAVFMQSFDVEKGISGSLTDSDLAAMSNFVLKQFGDPAAVAISMEDIGRSRSGWRGAGRPTAQRGQLITVGGGPGGAGAACFNCHGLQGQGDAGAGFPRLAGLDADYFAKQMRDYASGMRTNRAMALIARQLAAVDQYSLALYYAGLPPRSPSAAGSSADEPLVQRGAALYAGGALERGIQACADCHGPGGQGLNPVYPSLAQPAAYTDGQLRQWRDRARRNDPHDLMGSVSRRMTDEDVRAVAAYLGRLKP